VEAEELYKQTFDTKISRGPQISLNTASSWMMPEELTLYLVTFPLTCGSPEALATKSHDESLLKEIPRGNGTANR
jgi:hypothetical protein